jgi:hypothetical protein
VGCEFFGIKAKFCSSVLWKKKILRSYSTRKPPYMFERVITFFS